MKLEIWYFLCSSVRDLWFPVHDIFGDFVKNEWTISQYTSENLITHFENYSKLTNVTQVIQSSHTGGNHFLLCIPSWMICSFLMLYNSYLLLQTRKLFRALPRKTQFCFVSPPHIFRTTFQFGFMPSVNLALIDA